MSNEENDERETNLGGGTDAPAHQFDQTNGMADGLEGDADTPERAAERTGEGDGAAVLAAPAPGTQMAGGAIPAVAATERADDAQAEADADADDSAPTGP